MPEVRINTGFRHFSPLFKFDRCRGFAGAVVEDAVDVLDLVDDAAGDGLEQAPRDLGGFGRHEIGGGHGAQGHGIVVGALIAHNAHTAHVGQRGVVLADALIKTGFCNLLAPDGVGFLYHLDLIRRDFADDADGKAGAGERLAADEVFRQTQLTAGLTGLILKEVTQRLDDLLEIDVIRQTAYIVVRLDDGAFAAEAAFHDVGVDGALREEIDGANLLCFFFKDADELFADDLALLLRLRYAGEFIVEALASVDADEIELELAVRAEDLADFFHLVLAQQAVVDEYAGELLADGFRKHGCRNGGIDTAGKGAQHFAVANLLTQRLDACLDEGAHFPVALAAADVVDKVVQHRLAFRRVEHFRMELEAVEVLFRQLDGGDRAVIGIRGDCEACGRGLGVVVVAHPANGLRADVLKDLGLGIDVNQRFAVFTLRRLADMTAEQVRHELEAVAKSEHGDTEIENRGINGRRTVDVNAVRAAGEDDALGVLCANGVKTHAVGHDLAVYIALADAACDQLVILSAEVHYEHFFVLWHITPCLPEFKTLVQRLNTILFYSTVTDFARLRGLSISQPFMEAT